MWCEGLVSVNIPEGVTSIEIIHAGYGTCPECGHEFPPPERSNLTEHASKEDVLSGEIREEHYELIKDMTKEERLAHYRTLGKEAEREIAKRRAEYLAARAAGMMEG